MAEQRSSSASDTTHAQGDGPVLPNFLVIGAMKAGTTSLYHYLAAHPQVFMSPIKELDFFVENGNWKRGLEWYRNRFQGAGPDAIAIGEASTGYSKYPTVRGVPERVANHLPDARLVYVVRNPIERIRSHYEHRVAVGDEREPFEKAVFNNPVYLNCSRYALQMQQYLRYFSLETLLLITSEELRHNRESTMRRVYAFLSVESSYVPESLNHEFLRTSDRPIYSPTLGRVRHSIKRHFPATKRAKEFVDSVLPRSLGRVRPRRHVAREDTLHTVPNNVTSQLADHLKDDVRQLRSFMGDGFDGWGIA